MDVYLEVGKKRTFAVALNWPGWSRSAKDETSALQTLFEYGPRYARAIEAARLGFNPPDDLSGLTVIARLEGNVGTDFGAPAVIPAADAAPVGEADLLRFQALFESLWQSFDAAVLAADGKTLRTGPRGGGRDLEKIALHVFEAEQAYLKQLGGQVPAEVKQAGPRMGFAPLRQAILAGLGASARGELPTVGPRGGSRWSPRFFARYAAWHLLDHTWEIEDRSR